MIRTCTSCPARRRRSKSSWDSWSHWWRPWNSCVFPPLMCYYSYYICTVLLTHILSGFLMPPGCRPRRSWCRTGCTTRKWSGWPTGCLLIQPWHFIALAHTGTQILTAYLCSTYLLEWQSWDPWDLPTDWHRPLSPSLLGRTLQTWKKGVAYI